MIYTHMLSCWTMKQNILIVAISSMYRGINYGWQGTYILHGTFPVAVNKRELCKYKSIIVFLYHKIINWYIIKLHNSIIKLTMGNEDTYF